MGARYHTDGEGLKKKQLLIVDDAELFLQFNRVLLGRKDFVVHTATTGSIALQMVRKLRPDGVLLDLYIPGMNGEEVCRQIRSDPAICHTPVIMTALETDPGGRRRSLHAGCDDYIAKPVRADLLTRILEKHLGVTERIHPRTETLLPCVLTSGKDLLTTTIHSISAGGAFVRMNTPPLPGTRHRLTFSLPDGKDTVTVRALARWNRLKFLDSPVGSGFEFQELEPATYYRLDTWVKKSLDDPLFP